MKTLLIMVILTLFVGLTDISWAQGINNSKKTIIPATSKATSPINAFNLRVKEQYMQIFKALKAGTITKAQAVSLRKQIQVIRIQEINDIKQNSPRTLTSSQVQQLNQLLDTNSASLPTVK